MYNAGMEKRIKRVYVDSVAVGGKFNKRLAEQTKPFWDAVERRRIGVCFSCQGILDNCRRWQKLQNET